MLAVVTFVYSPKTVERVFAQLVADMREEYFGALGPPRRPWKARWILVRFYWSVAKTVGLFSVVRLAKSAFEMWKASQ